MSDEILSREDSINAAVAVVDVCKNFLLFDLIFNLMPLNERDVQECDARKADSSNTARRQKNLRQYFFDHSSTHICQSEWTTLEFIRELFMIESQLIQDSCLYVESFQFTFNN